MQPIFLSKRSDPVMLSTIITSTPIYVCSILSILLGLSLTIKWDRARYRLLMFMITATMFYIGHFAFYNRTESVVPITDTLYCFSYPAIFPHWFRKTPAINVRCYIFCLPSHVASVPDSSMPQ